MVKHQQKSSGCWGTVAGAENFLAIGSYLSTAAKQERPIIDVLGALATHQPWTPPSIPDRSPDPPLNRPDWDE